MKILWIRVRSFLSFGDRSQTLHLDKRGVVLITGDNRDDPSLSANGAGKTSIIDALVWCFYGVTSRKKLKGDDVINRFIGKNCEVEIAIINDEGVHYRILRTRKSKTWKTCFRLWQVDSGIKLDAVKHHPQEITDKKNSQQLEQIIKMNLTTFMNVVVFGQSDSYRFSNLSPAHQQAVFDEALGLQQYTEAGVAAKDRLNALERTLDAIERKLELSERTVASSKSYLKTYREAEGKFKEAKGERITAAQRVVKSSKEELAQILLTSQKIKSRLQKRDDAEILVKTATDDIDRLQRKLGSYESDVRSYTKESERLLQAIAKARNQGVGDCGECGQEITEDTVDSHVEELKSKRRKVEKRLAKASGLLSIRRKLTFKKHELTSYKDNLHMKQKLVDEATRCRRDIPIAVKKVDDAVKKLAAEEKSTSSYRAMIKAELKKIKQQALVADQLESKRERLLRKVDSYKFWVDAFSSSGIRALIVENALPALNLAAERITSELTAGNIAIRFCPQRRLKSGSMSDEFHIEVTNKHGSALLDGNSGGERSKVDICIGLALQSMIASRSSTSCNVVVFDEPFDRMDDVALDRVATFLTGLTGHDTVLLITHKEALKPYFSTILTVVKENDRSRLEW